MRALNNLSYVTQKAVITGSCQTGLLKSFPCAEINFLARSDEMTVGKMVFNDIE